jgi:hypothetical protein
MSQASVKVGRNDHQKEGNGNLYTVLRIQNRSVSLHPEIFRHLIKTPGQRGWLKHMHRTMQQIEEKALATYPKNGRIIWYPRWFLRCRVLLILPSDADVLYITSTEDDILIDAGGGGHFLGRVPTAPF